MNHTDTLRTLLALGLGLLLLMCVGTESRAEHSVRITNFYPDKARYAPGETVELAVEVSNPTDQPLSGPLQLRITRLGEEVHTESREISVGPEETAVESFPFVAPQPDFTGYLATVAVGEGEPVSTGIDVSSAATRFPRYGFISEFSSQGRDVELDSIPVLAREFHINMLQFYDWFWRHEKLIKMEDGEVAESWGDLFGRVNSWPVILDLIETAHRYDVLALGYVMIYAAREGYAELWPIEPAWGLFADPEATDQLDVQFTLGDEPTLFLFNPASPEWQDWIIDQYIEAVNLAGFDGVHIDQLGPRYNIFSGSGEPVDLPQTFPVFLDAVKSGLTANDPSRALCTFNIVDGEVDGWAVREVATSETCDFLYSEIWFEADTYDELRRYIEQLRLLGGGRPVVLAGYSNYNEEIGPLQEAESAAVLEGVVQAADNRGYTGTGYIDNFDAPGDAVTWFFDGPPDEPALVTFVFRFANATDTVATRNVYLDGNLIGPVRFSTRDQWSSWGTDAFIQATVEPGLHSLKLAFDPENVGVVNVDHLRVGEFDEDSVRLENAVMFASGATHIQLGDNVQSLSHEYYPNRSRSLTASLRRAVRRYYDFITAYENLLFDPDLEPLGTATQSLRFLTGQPLLESGFGGIMTIQRRKPGYDILHLINLMGVDNELWRDAASTPDFQGNLVLRYHTVDPENIAAIYVATPDFDSGLPAQRLEFTRGSDEQGGYLEFTVPRLEYWDMVFMVRTAGN